MTPKDRLIFALDVAQENQARELLTLLHQEVGLFKIGLELFISLGLGAVRRLAADFNTKFFLDLKFHDIPATVAGALAQLGPEVALTTIHCEGGGQLRPATAAAAAKGIQVLGVTVLTSLGPADLMAAGIAPEAAHSPTKLVLRRAALAQAAGCQGVVCAGSEAAAVKRQFGPEFLVVCPGIRPAGLAIAADDQARRVTPAAAIQAGADYLVVGRPIRTAPDPVAAARRIVAEIEAALPDVLR